ncbi:Hypothetical protein DHA2_7611 [Giardia duodenalis]|uniref:Uncharacterized protein n=1 Tax=Giardia intestinalis TaxID=5741 RepID=V6TB60_GIAIN|nr:Hypothetical protein DHA2_7611 [Giardia intestinalis]
MAESSEVTELKELADHYLTLQENCKASSQADLARAVYWTKLGTFYEELAADSLRRADRLEKLLANEDVDV